MLKYVFNFVLAIGLMAAAAPSMAQSDQEIEAYIQENLRYLEEDALRPDTIVRASGLLIHIIRSGEGGIVMRGQQAVVHYEGRLVDGTIFDSSYTRGQPSVFPINDVIRGWQEALTLMTIGSKWEVVMPASLGYGDRDDVDAIPPQSTLVFTIELLGAR